MSKIFRNQKGFTLIEVIVVMAVFAVLIFGASTMLNGIFVNSNQQILSMNDIDQTRLVSSNFLNEIRNATTGADGSYPLNQAGDSQIIFYSNYGTINGAINRFRYYISGNNLYKGVVVPSGSPSNYNISSESVKIVESGLMNASTPVFYYYDGNYYGDTNPLAQPVNINQVRFVKINLMVQNQITKNNSNIFSVAAGAAIRSVKDNLGN